MKKIVSILFLMMMAFVIIFPVLAETGAPLEDVAIDTAPTAQIVTEEPTPDPSTGPWT